MKQLISIVLLIGFIGCARADKWTPPTPQAHASPSGKLVLRVLPGDPQSQRKPLAAIFRLSPDGERYVRITEFPPVNRWSPVDACISDAGEVFTFDDWGSTGFEHAVVHYSSEGKVEREYSLAQLLPPKQLSAMEDEHRSVSSIEWRIGRPYVLNGNVIIPDSLGGHLCIADGVPEYMPREER